MDVFNQFLDRHEDRPRRQGDIRDRAKGRDAWQLTDLTPAERLLAFDTWVRRQLEARLAWPADPAHKARRIMRSYLGLVDPREKGLKLSLISSNRFDPANSGISKFALLQI